MATVTAKELKKSDFRITKSLQETLIKNKHIKEVYFSEEGEHYFMKHKIKLYSVDEANHETGNKDVECLPGATLGIIMIKVPKNNGIEYKAAKKNIDYKPVAAMFTREEILKATPSMDSKTEAEEIEILRQAAEIAKKGNFEDLMKKLNKN